MAIIAGPDVPTIRPVAAAVLGAVLASTIALGAPATSSPGRPSLPQVDCHAANTNAYTAGEARRMARKFSARGWQIVDRLDRQRTLLVERRETIRIQAAEIRELEAEIRELEAERE